MDEPRATLADPGTLADTIGRAEIQNLTADTLELGIDQILEDGPLRELPVVGSVVRLARAGLAIRDHLFLKKVFRFLYELRDVSASERRRFSERVTEDPDYRRKVGENLALLLDRANDLRKADLLGAIYRSHLRGKMDSDAVERLSFAVDRIELHDLAYLREFYAAGQSAEGADERLQPFAFAGLVRIRLGPGARLGARGGGYEPTDLGELFVSTVLAEAGSAGA